MGSNWFSLSIEKILGTLSLFAMGLGSCLATGCGPTDEQSIRSFQQKSAAITEFAKANDLSILMVTRIGPPEAYLKQAAGISGLDATIVLQGGGGDVTGDELMDRQTSNE